MYAQPSRNLLASLSAIQRGRGQPTLVFTIAKALVNGQAQNGCGYEHKLRKELDMAEASPSRECVDGMAAQNASLQQVRTPRGERVLGGKDGVRDDSPELLSEGVRSAMPNLGPLSQPPVCERKAAAREGLQVCPKPIFSQVLARLCHPFTRDGGSVGNPGHEALPRC